MTDVFFTKAVCLVKGCAHFGIIVELPLRIPMSNYLASFGCECEANIEHSYVTPLITCECGAEQYRAKEDSPESLAHIEELIERYT